MLLCPVQSPCRITQVFGINYQIYKRFGLKGHSGIDFTGPVKGLLVPVFACFDLYVYEVGNEGNDGYGKFVRLRTFPDILGEKREVVYGHLSQIDVREGQKVNLGDPIGVMGNTGFSTGPHLHLGLRRIAPDGFPIGYANGYKGYFDFLPFIRYWKPPSADMVTLVPQPVALNDGGEETAYSLTENKEDCVESYTA